MMRRLIVHIIFSLCLLISTNFSYANEIIPPQAIQVTPEDFHELKKEEVKSEKVEQGYSSVPSDVLRVGTGNRDTAVLIFAIVGTIMLVAWVPYTAILTYRAIRKPDDYKIHSLLDLQFLYLDSDENRNGFIGALQYTPFLVEKDKTSTAYFGLNFEVGRYHLKDTEENKSVKYNSFYWLIGPSILTGNLSDHKSGMFFKIDFLAGTSFRRDIGLILKADATIQFKFHNNVFTGIGAGADYLNGRSGRGIINNASNMNVHFLLTSGILF